jgi:apolipoprotein N-acyltransferase
VAGDHPELPLGARENRKFSRVLTCLIIATLAAWAATIGYGAYRLGQIARIPGPAVGAVQTSIPQLVKQEARHGDKDMAEEMMDDQVLRTRQVAGEAREAGLPLDLVVWPETMVPGILNQGFLEDDFARKIDGEQTLAMCRFLQERSRGYWRQIQGLSCEVGAPILYGANASDVEGIERLPGGRPMLKGPRWNKAFLMTPGLPPYAAAHTYAKVHLVPFGEFVPFKESWPWLREQLMSLSPYDFDWTVEPGDAGQTPFTIDYRVPGTGLGSCWMTDRSPGGQGTYLRRLGPGTATARFQVAICYEDSMAYRIRDMARPPARGQPKAVDFLVNISNDGWFNGSVELDQHLDLCVFRAVENRLPIVRSVNTGVSALIQSDGRIERPVTDAEGHRLGVAGQTFGRLLLDGRVTAYTWIGDVFAKACVAAAALGLGWAILRDRRARRAAPR